MFKRKIYLNIPTRVLKVLKKQIPMLTIVTILCSSIPIQNYVLALDSSNEEKLEFKNENVNIADVPIQYEVKEKRDKFTKHFKKMDGTYEMVMYNEAVHYKNNGIWEEIDNSLVYDENSQSYENKANAYKIKLPNKISENKKISLKYDNYGLDWNFIDIKTSEMAIINEKEVTEDEPLITVENVNKRVIYSEIQEQVDLEYFVKSEEIKENIILKEYKENFSISLELSTKNLFLIKEEEHIYFIDENNNIVYDFGSLIMFDKGENHSNNIQTDIEEIGKDKYILTITPDDNWLKDEFRTYPVTIDPTIFISNNSSNPINDKSISTDGHISHPSYLRVGQFIDTMYQSYIQINLD